MSIIDEFTTIEEFVLDKVEDFLQKVKIAPFFQDTKDKVKCGALGMAKTALAELEKARKEWDDAQDKPPRCLECLVCEAHDGEGDRIKHPCSGCSASFGVAEDMKCTMTTCPHVCDKFNALPASMEAENKRKEKEKKAIDAVVKMVC